MVCPECKGKRYSSASERGYLSKNDMQLCPVCHGTGEVPEVPEEKVFDEYHDPDGDGPNYPGEEKEEEPDERRD